MKHLKPLLSFWSRFVVSPPRFRPVFLTLLILIVFSANTLVFVRGVSAEKGYFPLKVFSSFLKNVDQNTESIIHNPQTAGLALNSKIKPQASYSAEQTSESHPSSEIVLGNSIPKIVSNASSNNINLQNVAANGASLTEDVSLFGGAYFSSGIKVKELAEFEKSAEIAERLTVGTRALFQGDAEVQQGLTVNGSATVNQDLTVGAKDLHVDTTTDRVGIGTVHPQHKLDVAGNVKVGQELIVYQETTLKDKLQVQGETELTGILNANGGIEMDGDKFIIDGKRGDVETEGTMRVHDQAWLNSNVSLGNDSSDTLETNARVGSHFIPKTTDTYDLGSSSLYWNNLYAQNLFTSGTITPSGNITPGADNTYSLGSSLYRWKDLYLGPASLKIYNSIGANAEYATLGFSSNVATLNVTRDGSGTYRPFAINQNGSETMRITGGNVGIGTTSPSYKLDISGTTRTDDLITKGPVPDVRAYGVHGNGTDDDRDHINTAQTAIGVGEAIYFPPGTYKISSNLTISSDIIFASGARFSIDSGKVVTITGNINAPLQQIFSGLGTVSFTGNYKLQEVYSEWWGAIANGASGTDNTSFIQAAINAMSVGGTLRFLVGTYKITSINVTKAMTIVGSHQEGTIFSVVAASSNKGFNVSVDEVNFEHLSVISSGTKTDGLNTIGIYYEDPVSAGSIGYSTLNQVTVSNFSDAGVKVLNSIYFSIKQIRALNCTKGIYYTRKDGNVGTTFSIDGGYITGCTNGIHLEYTLKGTIKDVILEYATYGIVLNNSSAVMFGLYFEQITTNDVWSYDSYFADIGKVRTDKENSVTWNGTAAGDRYVTSFGWHDLSARTITAQAMTSAGFVKNSTTGLLSGGNALAVADIPVMTSGEFAGKVTGGLLSYGGVVGDVPLTVQNEYYNSTAPTASLIFKQRTAGFTGSAGKIVSTRIGAYNESSGSHDSALAFYTANNDVDSEHMRITNLGNVGIGTTTPQSKLQVNGYIQMNTNNDAPAAADCDSDLERGRMILDYTNNRLYVCNGATRGWDYIALTD